MPPKSKINKQDIIEIAFNQVRKYGWEGLTARFIAKKLGTSTRPIYTHFKSMRHLEEAVVQRAMSLLHQYMTEKRTDDPWLDHGIGYIKFALEEKMLFWSVNDQNHIEFQKTHGDVVWAAVTADLADYPPFQGLSTDLIYRIQMARWLLAHGTAFWASNARPEWVQEDQIADLMRDAGVSLLEGLKKKAAQQGGGR